NLPSAAATTLRQSSTTPRSACTYSVGQPSTLNRSATRLPFSALRPQITSPFAPRSANSVATPSPSPCLPPVTIATFPSIRAPSVCAMLVSSLSVGDLVPSCGERRGQVIAAHARILKGGRLDRILLGFHHRPALVADVGQQARESVVVDEA